MKAVGDSENYLHSWTEIRRKFY